MNDTQKRGKILVNQCFFCRKAAESINDLLLHCAGTRSL